jgi:Na+-driven multidrug efflux pump
VEGPLPESVDNPGLQGRPVTTTIASPVRPFLVGTLVGGLAGAALGTVLSRHTRGFFVGLYQLLSRRLSSSERDQLRFELLLQ